MAQIIKHRRGSIDALASATAKKGELIMATGSIGNMNGPWIFVGETEGSAGAFRGVSKIYQGTAAPDLTVGTWGSTLNGTPFHSSADKTLYVLSNSGNVDIDLTGNIEGNTISGVTINNLTGTTAYIANISGSFTGSGVGLYNIPASGITGLELNRISQGAVTASITEANGFNVNTNSAVTGTFNVNGNTSITGTFVATNGAAFIEQGVISQNSDLLLTSGSNLIIQDSGNINVAGNVYVTGSEYVDNVISRTGNGFNALHLNSGTYGAPDVELTSATNISLFAEGGTPVVNVTGSLKVTGDVTVEQDMHVSGNIYQTGSFYTQGDIVLSGSINIGDNISTDVINFNGEVSSSIIPKIHNAFDLGSTVNNWRNLHVSGTAYVDTLQARQVNFSDLGILQDLTVSGSTYLGNGGDITVVSGSIYNDQLTNTRVLFAGVNGEIKDNSGFTFDSSSGYLVAPIVHATDDGNGTNFLIGNDMWLGDIDEGNATRFMGNEDNNYAKIYLGATTDQNYLSAAYGDVTLSANNVLNLQAQNNNVNVSAYDGSTLYLNADGGEGNVEVLNGGGSTLNIHGDTLLTGSLFGTKIAGTGSLYLQPDQGDSRYFQIYNTSPNDTHIKANGGLSYFGDDVNYLKIDDSLQTVTITGVNGVAISSSLSVTGSAQFLSTINVDGIATVSSSVVENLTQNRIVGVGAGSALVDYSGLTYDGTTLKVGGGKFEVDNSDGDIRTSGSLTVDGGQTINGDVTVNGVLTVTGDTQLQSNLYVSGNLEVLGSSTNVNLQSTTVEIGDNIILVNAYSPFQRYAGLTAYDSGSVGTSGSMLWDSLNNYWLLQNADASTSKVIGTTSGSMGSEVSLTDTYFPIATGTNTIGDSLLRYSGTTLSFNTNKFTIDSGTGDTEISGNLTLSYSGGTDNGATTSNILFRNSTNVLGYVGSADTENVTDRLLGYNASTGNLEFSSVIDGGTY